MEKIRLQLQNLFQFLGFSDSAREALWEAFEKIECHPEYKEAFLTLIAEYRKDQTYPLQPLFTEMKKLSDRCGFHEYTGNLLLLSALCAPLKQHYERAQISDEIYKNTIRDLQYKLTECELVKGTEGIFVPSWYQGIFHLRCFGLGRLQFIMGELNFDRTLSNGFQICKGQKAICVHIPRTGTRLLHEEVLDSYRQAKDFFRNQFPDGKTVFTCSSWLLDPWHLEILSKNSNIRAFLSDFEILKVSAYPDYTDIWRLFDMEYRGNPDELPADSSLRRAYIEKIRNGEKVCYAMGVFVL